MSRQSAALSSATQHAMPPEFSAKWRTQSLNTRFPLPTWLLCIGIQSEAGFNIKVIHSHHIDNIPKVILNDLITTEIAKKIVILFPVYLLKFNVSQTLMIIRYFLKLDKLLNDWEIFISYIWEWLNTKFPLPTLPCAGYSVKLIFKFS